MLDDFLGIVYRQPGESDHALLNRGRMAEKAFDEELNRMGITKQSKKDSPTAWQIVWLGFEIDTKEGTLAIPQEKEESTLLQIQDDLFNDDGGVDAIRRHGKAREVGGNILPHEPRMGDG